MKPFDLEAAKAGAPLITRNGESVRFAAHVPFASEDMRVIVVRPNGCLLSYCEDGAYNLDGNEYHHDLLMATVKRAVYVNFYARGSATYHDTAEKAKDVAEKAKDVAVGHAIAVAVPVEIEE